MDNSSRHMPHTFLSRWHFMAFNIAASQVCWQVRECSPALEYAHIHGVKSHMYLYDGLTNLGTCQQAIQKHPAHVLVLATYLATYLGIWCASPGHQTRGLRKVTIGYPQWKDSWHRSHQLVASCSPREDNACNEGLIWTSWWTIGHGRVQFSIQNIILD